MYTKYCYYVWPGHLLQECILEPNSPKGLVRMAGIQHKVCPCCHQGYPCCHVRVIHVQSLKLKAVLNLLLFVSLKPVANPTRRLI